LSNSTVNAPMSSSYSAPHDWKWFLVEPTRRDIS
jgi:hypothetical protein